MTLYPYVRAAIGVNFSAQSNSSKVNYTYDKLNRITSRTVTNGSTYSTAYTYVPGSSTYGANATTPLVATIMQGSGANAMNFAYTYDNRGNITSETRNGVTTTYEYDALGQLTRVNDPNDPTGSTFGTTWIYSYDRGGNILNKSAYVYTTGTIGIVVRSWAYGYDDPNWKDKLTSFDGHTITYDAIGNPLNDGEWTYEWQAGRQLKRMTNLTTGVVMEFTYNHAGIRTKKVKKENCVAVETTEYILNGKQVVGLVHTDHTTNTTEEMQFFYDAQGRVSMLKYGGALYSYVHNLQGDVVGILDDNGDDVIVYKYDTWGRTIYSSTHRISNLNPFRYKGYIGDYETCLIYLLSRSYSPLSGRFVNADVLIDETNSNLFEYCKNSYVGFTDSTGYHIDGGADGGCDGGGGIVNPSYSKSKKKRVKAYVTTIEITVLYEIAYAYGTCTDSYGNEAIFETCIGVDPAGPIDKIYAGIGGVGISGSYGIQWFNADSVKDLAGVGCYLGGSVNIGIGPSVGVDIFISGKTIEEIDESDKPDGYQLSVGGGFGITWVHTGNAYTRVMITKCQGKVVPESERVWYYG